MLIAYDWTTGQEKKREALRYRPDGLAMGPTASTLFYYSSDTRNIFVVNLDKGEVNEKWLRAVMAPLETQVREYQVQLKRRLESVKRIHQATDTLVDRVRELQQAEDLLVHQLAQLNALAERIELALEMPAGSNTPSALAA